MQGASVPLQDSYFPQFDAVKPEHVVPGIRQVLKQVGDSLDSLEAGVAATWEGLVEPLERMTDQLSRAWGVVSHLKVPDCHMLAPAYDSSTKM